jgi:hypothetical protein
VFRIFQVETPDESLVKDQDILKGVYNDMRKAGINNWRIKAKDRNGWWRILEEAKAHLWGCGATAAAADDDDDMSANFMEVVQCNRICQPFT